MALFVDGVEIPPSGDVVVDGVSMDKVVVDGVEVWKKFIGIWSGSSYAVNGSNKYNIVCSGNQLHIVHRIPNGTSDTTTTTISFNQDGTFTGTGTSFGELLRPNMYGRGASSITYESVSVGSTTDYGAIIYDTSNGTWSEQPAGGALKVVGYLDSNGKIQTSGASIRAYLNVIPNEVFGDWISLI